MHPLHNYNVPIFWCLCFWLRWRSLQRLDTQGKMRGKKSQRGQEVGRRRERKNTWQSNRSDLVIECRVEKQCVCRCGNRLYCNSSTGDDIYRQIYSTVWTLINTALHSAASLCPPPPPPHCVSTSPVFSPSFLPSVCLQSCRLSPLIQTSVLPPSLSHLCCFSSRSTPPSLCLPHTHFQVIIIWAQGWWTHELNVWENIKRGYTFMCRSIWIVSEMFLHIPIFLVDLNNCANLIS